MKVKGLMSDVDYGKIGLKVGLEIHQQLDTREKLFCHCKPELFKDEVELRFLRRLRPTQSELGQIDEAALFEFRKGLLIEYEADTSTSCLVEMDEEPPHELNPEAVEIALMIALMLNSKPVDEIYVMRKIVIDGSNTTGFQRTCVIALGGEVKVDGKKVPIQHVGLEEDAARKTGGSKSKITYRIDRLGIPLIEITTAPTIKTPEEARKVALAIGRMLRYTGRVRRGIGTVRQDLNISISEGALIEIKGVQELEIISKVVKFEVKRQLNLLKIKRELAIRGVKETDLDCEAVDVTDIFRDTACKVISKKIKSGGRVLAVKLKGFAGLIGLELTPNLRFGTELADVARFWGDVGGIFHTDEMPKYGITQREVEEMKRRLNCEGQDAIVFLADRMDKAKEAVKAIIYRAKEALKGVPEETRAANPDGTSRYMRPRPGAARMYPETDVPPVVITKDVLERIRKTLPESFEVTMRRLKEEYGLNPKLLNQILNSKYLHLFEKIVKEIDVSPTLVAVTLTETVKSLEREGVRIDKLRERHFEEIFKLISVGATFKESIPEILRWLAENSDRKAEEAVKALNLQSLSSSELREILRRIVEENASLIKERGLRAYGVLMGMVMRLVRGRADAEVVSEMLKEIMLNYAES